MAKTARITGNIQGHAGQDLTYTIYSDHGSVLTSPEEVKATLADGVKFTYDSGDAEEVFAPFMSSTAELRFIVDHDDEIDALVEMARGSESDTYIIFERANGWRWIGSLLPEDVEVEITDGHTEIGMTFTDGLSLLKGMDFKVDSDDIFIRSDETAGSPYQPGRTGLGLVWVLLNKIPWMQEVSWPAGAVAIREAAGIGTDTSGTYRPNLPYIGLNPSAFSKEKKQPRRGRTMPKPKSFVNCYDVLGDILETLGMRIAWDGEGWTLRSPLIADDFATGVLEYTFEHADLVANGRGAIDGSLAFTPWSYDLDVSYAMEEGATRRFTQKFSGARAIHKEAGSNQLFNKFDNVLYPDADRLENKDQLRDSDPLVEFESESDITLRTQGYFDLKGGLKAKNASGHKPCAVIKLKLGTTSHSSDPYLLSSEMLVQGYDTTITGAAAASDMRCWANATLPDAEWILESAKGADAFDKPGLLYIPLTWSGDSFNPNAPSVDHGADGTFYGGLHTALKSGETNVLKYDKWGQLHFDVTLPTIVTPGVDLEGYEIEFGLAFFGAGEFPMGTNKSPEILNTVTGATTGTGTAEEELFDEYVEKFVFHRGRLFKGDGTGEADRIYFEETSNGAPDSFQFAEVRIASGTQEGGAAVGPKFINRNANLWSSGTEAWSYDIDWISYSGNVTSNPATQENLELLADEWLLNNSGGVEVLSSSFAPNYLTASAMPTGADLFSTACTTPGTFKSYYLPMRFTWSSISGLEFEGVEMLRDTTVTTFPGFRSEEEEPNMSKPFVKAINDGLAGKNKSTADTEILAGVVKTAQDDATALVDGATTFSDTMTESSTIEVHGAQGGRGIGGPNKYLLNGPLTPQTGNPVTNNLHFIGGVNNNGDNVGSSIFKLGLTDFDFNRQGALAYNTVDGGLTINGFLDTSGGSAGDVLKIDSTGNAIEWGSGGSGGGGATELDDLTDVSASSPTGLDFLQYNGTVWTTNSAGNVADTLAALTDLEELANVTGTPTAGKILKYDGFDWAVSDEAATPTLDEVLAAGNTSTREFTTEKHIITDGTNTVTIDPNDATTARMDVESTTGNSIVELKATGGNVFLKGYPSATGTFNFNKYDATGSERSMLRAENSTNIVALCNRTANGTTEIRANNASAGGAGEVVVAQADATNGLTIMSAYTMPTTDGTSGQVMQTDGAGNITFATPTGGGSSNPEYRLERTCYNSVTTSTDLWYWMPGSTTYGFDFYDGSEKSTLGTTGLWNQYKKMSHRLKAGTYDLDISVDVSVAGSTNGASHASDAAGDTVQVLLYKVGADSSGGDAVLTQIGATENNVQHATDTAQATETNFTRTSVTMDGNERLMLVLKGTSGLTTTRYVHWAYDIHAEKTA